MIREWLPVETGKALLSGTNWSDKTLQSQPFQVWWKAASEPGRKRVSYYSYYIFENAEARVWYTHMPISGISSDAVEVEYQFDCADLGLVERWLRGQPANALLQFTPRDASIQSDTYFDTEDWSIYRANFSLRVRRRVTGAEATLKSLASGSRGLQSRREITQTIPEGDDDLLAGAGPVSERLRMLIGRRTLRPLFEIITHRLPFSIQQDGRTLAELTLDDAVVRWSESSDVSLKRVEIEEAQTGGIQLIQPFVEALVSQNRLVPAQSSKFESGLLAAGLSPSIAPDVGPCALHADMTAGEFGYAILRAYFLDFLRHEQGTRLGEDPEELHDMRVTTRRLRAAFNTFNAVLPVRFSLLADEFRSVARDLGAVRDLDVQLEEFLRTQAGAGWDDGNALAPLILKIRAARDEARRRLIDTLDSTQFAAFVQEMTESLQAGTAAPGESATPILDFSQSRIQRRYRQFRNAAELLTPVSDMNAFHDVRVRAKKLRYTFEFFRALYGKRATRMISAVTAVQDLLGEMHDCSVAVASMRRLAEEGTSLPPPTLLLMGELLERRRTRIERLREEWPSAYDRIREYWRPLKRSLRQGEDGKGEDSIDQPENETTSPDDEPPRPRPEALLRRMYRRIGR